MFREFNVKFEDVEILGGADNLLEGTEITKVITRGDNKMSSLDSMLKNCNELDTIDGELDLNGVSDIDNLLEGTELVKSINLKNINNENITANNSFPYVESINIGGEVYDKRAMQNVIASKDWTFDNITYSGDVGENLLAKSATMIDDDKTTIKNTLEQKARGFEIIGQTYENLVVGSGEATLLDELTLESVDGNSKEFNPHLEQPVCVEAIEGETYQNLVEGKGEYKLTDTFSTTWTESNNSIENPPSMIEIPEIWGNTVQGYANIVTAKMIVDSINNSGIGCTATLKSDKKTLVVSDATVSNPPSNSDNFMQLKANTTYSLRCYRLNSAQIVNVATYHGNNPAKAVVVSQGGSFTTDSSGKVLFYPHSVQGGILYFRCVEGQVDLSQYAYDEMDLNYIQSVGDLYVDESGEPILDEEGNEQYKLEIESANNINLINPNNWTPTSTASDHIQIIKLEPNTKYIYYGNQSNNGSIWHSLIYCDAEGNETKTIFNSHCPTSNVYRFTTGNDDNIYIKAGWATNPDYINKNHLPMLVKGSKVLPYIEGTGNNQSNKTTILMPQPLRKVGDYKDKLYWDYERNKYILEVNIDPYSEVSTSSFSTQTQTDNYITMYQHIDRYPKIKSTTVLCNTLPSIKNFNATEVGVYGANAVIYFTLRKSELTSYDVLGFKEWFTNNPSYLVGVLRNPLLIETKILEKPSLETYSPKTYIFTNAEIQPSQMNITNKKVDFIPLGLQANKDYTLQLDSIGVNNEFNLISLGEWEFYNSTQIRMYIKFNNMPNNIVSFNNNSSKRGFIEFINSSGAVFSVLWLDTDLVIPNGTVSMYFYIHECTLDAVLGIQPKLILKNKHCFCANLGGDNVLIENTNDTSKHHKVVVRTPATLTTDTLELSGEGVVANDVMLFEGGSNEIKQDVEYVEGIQNIGELVISKNKFPNVVFTKGKTMMNYNGSIVDSSTDYATEEYIKCNLDSSKVYSVTSNCNYVKIAFYDSEKVFISILHTNTDTYLNGFTVPSNAKFYRVCCNNQSNIEIKIQIEEGNTHTAYEEYFEGEKYKIDILSNDDLFANFLYDKSKNINGYELTGATNDLQVNANKATTDFIKVPNNGEYYINTSKTIQPTIFQYDENKNYIPYTQNGVRVYDPWLWSTIYNGEYYTQHMNNTHYIRISLNLTDVDCLNISLNNDKTFPSPVGKSTTQSILLPQPLNKIGELKDKFYWDDNKGHYCIEENFARESSNDLNWTVFNQNDDFIYFRSNQLSNNFKHSDKGLCNKLTCYQQYSLSAMNKEGLSLRGNTMDIVLSKTRGILSIEQLKAFINDLFVIWELEIPQIIDLPHLNKKYSLDTYMPTTYAECTNNPMQPSRLLLESDTVRYKPSTLETDTDYTIQFECKEKTDKKVKLNLGGSEKEVDAIVGLNHVSMTTPSEIDTSLYKDRLFLSGVGNKVADVIVAKGEMNQYPEYFNGVQSVGELQDDGTYRIGIETNCGEGLDFSNTKPTMIINQNGNMANDSYVTSEGYLCILRNDGGYGYNQLYGFFDTDSIGIPRGVDCYVSYRTLYMIIKDIGRVNLTNQPNRYGVVVDSSSNYVTGSNGGITTGVINIPNDGARYYLRTQVSYDGYALQNNTCQEFCLIYNCMPTNLPVTLENFKPIKKHKTSITSNNALAKGDKLYWNKSNKRYEIDRGGSIEVPTVSGDVIDLPRLYQREDTHFSTSTGNIKPSRIKLDYNDLD